MGKFSKKDNRSDFFQNMKSDTENEWDNSDPKLGDFEKNDDEFKTGTFKIDFTSNEQYSAPMQMIINKVKKNEIDDVVEDSSVSSSSENETLLEKCKPFTVDDNGHDCSENDAPIYELKSVAEILKSDSLGALENLSKKYNITIKDETDKSSEKSKVEEKSNFDTKSTKESDNSVFSDTKKTPTFIDMVKATETEEKSDDKIFEDYFLSNNPEVQIVNVRSSIPDISDIDNSQKLKNTQTEKPDNTSTIRFTPVKTEVKGKSKVSILSTTSTIEFGKKSNFPIKGSQETIKEPTLQKNDFEEFSSFSELNNLKEAKSYFIALAKRKRISFLQLVFSSLATLGLALNFIAPLYDRFITSPKSAVLLSLIIFLFNFLINIDMLTEIKNRRLTDISVAFTSVSAAILGFFQYSGSSNEHSLDTFYLLVLTSSVLTFRAFSSFINISSKHGSLKQIIKNQPKNALTFIGDTSVTFAMANNTIEGDVLVAGSRKADFIKDFNKYYDYRTVLFGKFGFFQVVYTVFAVIFGIIGYLYYKNAVSALFCSTCILSIFSIPCLFLINNLPMYSAFKTLSKSDAMISGIEGAMQIESSNAVVVSASEIFPEGSIVLKDIKILSNNTFDDTILKAASITEAMNSPLTPIFKQIAKTNSTYSLPDSDTVKYEEKLGISGWVDNELLFIGNRTLLESHGIEVPGIEVDKRILRNGYFPIYLATSQKACALIIVKYNPSYTVAKELRKITNLGVTLLVKNSDPNISEPMLADYFDIYEDTIKIISNAGLKMYENSTQPIESVSATAVFSKSNLSIVKILNAASAIKKSNSLLSFIYALSFIFLTLGFVYLTFSQHTSLPSALTLLISELCITLFSITLYLIKKP